MVLMIKSNTKFNLAISSLISFPVQIDLNTHKYSSFLEGGNVNIKLL